ncbi:TMCO1/EMC3 family protein [Candidatus Woesearchaeota archaeon]|nr:TMCO1/EMC3 family protein [Candidatus Woesearchaeota archaeon]
MSMLNPILNPIFSGLMNWSPAAVIAIFALIVALIVTIIYKYATDQTVMKDLKMRQKQMQKRMKEARGDPQKQTKLSKEAMELNMQYMSHSMKSMLFTFIPVIIIFGWLNANLAYEPLHPETEFNISVDQNPQYTGEVTIVPHKELEVIGGVSKEIEPAQAKGFLSKKDVGRVSFTLKGEESDDPAVVYPVSFEYEGNRCSAEVMITDEQRYSKIDTVCKNSPMTRIHINNQKLVPLNLFGKDEGGWGSGRFGWLFTYIIFSMIFSIGLRKILKVY